MTIKISASMVKELRERTGAGMMDCKKALQNNEGDIEASMTFLREKGLAAAAKKAGRIAAEGLIGFAVKGSSAVVLELNCETDFVAKNDDFKTYLSDLTAHCVENKPKSVDEMMTQKFFSNPSETVENSLNTKISKIGEKITVRRFNIDDSHNAHGGYIHTDGSIGVLVSLDVSDNAIAESESVKTLARDIAMHVASESPLAVSREEIDPAVIEAEKSIFIAQAKEQGKPDNIIERMVDGRINKFLAESCLLDQSFVKNPDLKVSELIAQTAKELGTEISLATFTRFKVGEGIEKKTDNLADEVAKMM